MGTQEGTISIGNIGGVCWDEKGKRWKGIIPGMCMSLDELFRRLTGIITDTSPTSTVDDVRLTFRIFVGPDVNIDIVKQVRLPWNGTEVVCEAVIPLGKHGNLAYFGGNTPKRASGTATRVAEWTLLNEMLNRERTPLRQLPAGFEVTRLTSTNVTDGEISDIVDLYRVCYSSYMVEFNDRTVRDMIRDNVFVAVRNERGQIVCVGQAEKVSIDTGAGGVWTLIEVSENATDPNYRSMGLSQHARIVMIEAVRGPNTIIYVESRINHAGVIGANLKIGMHPAGRLDHHTFMDSTASEVLQEGSYNTLLVMHLPVME